MGGDEFVIIILPQYFDIWEKIVKNIIAMFRKPWYLMETEYSVSYTHLSNIVRMLENEGPFKDVIYVILENVSKYLKMPDVTVMQYDEERTCLYPVLSYGGRHHLIQAAEVQAAAAQTAPQGTVERQVKAAADSPLYGEKLCLSLIHI